jgi:hypothetical protein
MAEQAALDLRQRQHALDLAVLLDIIKPGLVAERLFDDLLPPGQVEEGGVRAAAHERVPARIVLRLQQVQGLRGGGNSRRGAARLGRFDNRTHGGVGA